MRLYNIAKDRVEDVKVVTIGNENIIVSKATEQFLNSGGYYYIESTSPLDKRYYDNTKTKALIVNKYVMGYTSVQKSLYDVQERMLKDLRTSYEDKSFRPLVDTGLGYNVYGGQLDVIELQDAKDNTETIIVDADNNEQTVDGASYTIIATAVKTNRNLLRTTGKIKVSEVKILVDVDDCILYEKSPYDCPELDDQGVPTGGTVTCYRNKVKDWEI